VLESKYKPGITNQVADALRISRKAELVALKGEELAAICRIHGTLPERGRFRERREGGLSLLFAPYIRF
jgi:hypothetical protein